ncbi:type II secretion system protein [Nocardioides sp. SLBN-35]|uniref:type II secretion system protein n=1 Tax=Nocardioides sp. SLBN-35 TaxID=2768445 RepID=UPI00116E690E|nr:prepilin-type N-terminal cleavage/methylation domain-containing protein [Nocardioides sp. SLBN-35]TQK70358.1 prepilin-type N-terminal cleavage/methylation domain-containing protein [Nocardioides sp. SLBN-35]
MPELKLSRRARRDEGVTLIELVITVSIIGVVTVALTGVMLSYLRNTADTQARLTESHDVQFAAAYWQRDVSSIGVRAKDPDPATGIYVMNQSVFQGSDHACGSVPVDATAVGTLAWSDYAAAANNSTVEPETVKVSYAWRGPVDDVYELLRVRCGTDPSTVQIADSLAAPPVMSCVPGCTGQPRVVTLDLDVRDPSGEHNDGDYSVTLTGERRQS